MKTWIIAALLVLSALAFAPGASARTCVLGDNPSALLNVCYGPMSTTGPGFDNDGTCIVGNFCPDPETRRPYSGQSCYSVGTGASGSPTEYGTCLDITTG